MSTSDWRWAIVFALNKRRIKHHDMEMMANIK